MDGLLLFDKPGGWTSHDAVDFVRRCAGQKKVGHAGTLDPMATGLLVIMLGAATRSATALSGMDKAYEGVLTLGVETDSWDKDGRILAQKDASRVREADLRAQIAALTGEIEQTPPAFSAIKTGGKKFYELARQGIQALPPPRKVKIAEFELLHFRSPEAAFRVSCSKGTYIRSLAHEIGRRLGCGAMLSALVRTRIGPYELGQALSREMLQTMSPQELEKGLIAA